VRRPLSGGIARGGPTGASATPPEIARFSADLRLPGRWRCVIFPGTTVSFCARGDRLPEPRQCDQRADLVAGGGQRAPGRGEARRQGGSTSDRPHDPAGPLYARVCMTLHLYARVCMTLHQTPTSRAVGARTRTPSGRSPHCDDCARNLSGHLVFGAPADDRHLSERCHRSLIAREGRRTP